MAGVASLGTMVTILALALWFRNIPALKRLVAYSMISVAVIFVSGGLTAAAMATHHPLFGLIERITIFTFTLWVFVIGRRMAQLEENPPQQTHFKIAGSTSKGK
jgi:transketolase C-terminal domain/subunit